METLFNLFGLVFLLALAFVTFHFLLYKHRKIVNITPNVEFGVLQKKEVITAKEKLEDTNLVGVKL